MWMVVLVAHQDTLTRPPHSILFIVFFKSFQSRNNRRVFFWLCFFGAKCVVGERVESNCLRLVGIEVFG